MIDAVLNQGALPLMAILRGVEPEEVVAIGQALVDNGIRLIEVPFNSPRPADSIARLHQVLGETAVIGGGTIVTADRAEALADAGGRFMVSPNSDPAVIERSVALGLEAMPGFLTPTEAYVAIGAGARRLKLFPGSAMGAGYASALRDVLPRDVTIWSVGGASLATLADIRKQGFEGVGLGGSLYRAGDTASVVGDRAAAFAEAWRSLT